ncbi:hypothetical protein GYMLUDRAFT_182853 [Collybiopsis luxurians FD-317 M1]|uniref:Uncharacterized protein n=1 Tax=Collybiopsis luxurians FD-317 M1 TaxID=944289 RepID=A0A0D0AJK7_9AGAR|nr:hypothetical protein GYMLUDRAFT_182853 [Collybiopsis luxurians FD-317 M1]
MTCLLKIGGHTAHVMFDLGSSIDAISPHFANACSIKVFKLESQEHLQLGTIGSCTKFKFGTWSPITIGETNVDMWWDVVNINKYSGIIGSRWMQKNKVVLDTPSSPVFIVSKPTELLFFPINEVELEELSGSVKYTDADIPQLCAKWIEKYRDILSGVPETLPPLREINHQIQLINESKRYNYYMPCCPDSLKVQLSEKLERYSRAQWWISTTVLQAAPMLCIPKKNGKICTIVDYRQQNENTVKDITPFPDQDHIWSDIARHKY